MSLEIRRNSDGTIRRVWYGRYEINGHRHCLNLGVKIAGNPPASLSLRDPGDIVFERSRATAFAKLVNFTEEARVKHNQEHILEKLYEHKVGEPIRSVLIGDLPQKWQPSKQPAAKRYIRQARSTLARFTKHIETQYPRVTEITDVNRDMARSFMEAEGSRAITNKTWNDILILLRAAFKSLLPPGGINPFSEFKRRPTDTIFRVPFTANELNAIEEATQQDAFIRPVVITGICTAMREGDCCLLKWRSVDLERRFITVKTLKTGTTVTIPIFPLLLRELSERAQTHEYVFPDQAAMYLTNPDGITWRFRKILKAAGFKDNATDGNISGPNQVTGVEIHARRSKGVRVASIRDFASLRTTWVTVALTGGVPIELVRMVTGHQTAEIVLRHYYKPGQEDFRRALETAMPKLLTNGQPHPKEEIRELLTHTSSETWATDSRRLLELTSAL